jgi:iron complex outermembrane receptor protein
VRAGLVGFWAVAALCSSATLYSSATRCAAAAAHAAPTLLPPTPLSEPDLVYPADALVERVGGLVVLELELGADGQVRRIERLESPDARLTWAAFGAAAGLSFAPAQRVADDGTATAIAVRFRYTLTFAPDAVEEAHRALHDDARAADGRAGDDPRSVSDASLHPPAVDVLGRVLVDGARTPVAGARVDVEGSGVQSVTGPDGTFALRGVPPGSGAPLVLHVEAQGFDPAHVDLETRDNEVIEVVVLLQQPTPTAETVVHARRARREIVRRTLTQAVAELDEVALARVRGRTLAGTLTELAGVTMVQSGPALEKPVVRGQFGRRLLLLSDGVRLEGQDWGIDHAPELDVGGAGRITVVKGAAGVRFGPDALGGVILVEPQPLRTTPGIDGELSLAGVDNGLRGMVAGRVDAVFAALPELSLRLEADLEKGAAMSTPDYVIGNSASEMANLAARAAWRTSVLDTPIVATLSYTRYMASLGICYCLKVRTPADLNASLAAGRPPGADAWRTDYAIDRPRQELAHDTAVGRVVVDLGERGQLSTTYAFQSDRRDEFDQVRRSVDGPQYSFALATHAIDALYDQPRWRAGRLTLQGQIGARADLQEHAYRGLQLIPNYRRLTGGAFVLERLGISDVGGVMDVELLVGGRIDGLTQTAFLADEVFLAQRRRGRLDDDDCALQGEAARCGLQVPAASFTTGARARIDQLTLQLDVSSATRFADVDELYLGGRAPSLPVFGLGNAGLTSERTVQGSLGAVLDLPALWIDVGAFASRVDDYIAFGPERRPDGAPIVDVLISGAYPRFSYRRVDAMLSGFDGEITLLPREWFSVDVHTAYVRALDLTRGGFLPFIPPLQTRVAARLRAPAVQRWPWLKRAELTTHVTTTARQTRTDLASDFAPPPDGYVLWGAVAETDIEFGGLPFSVGLEGRNLGNARYRDPLSLTRFFVDQPGRELWLRVSMRFDAPTASSPSTTDQPTPVSRSPGTSP